MKSFKSKTVNGILWSSTSQVSSQILSFITSIVLARLLMPEDFGVIGMITVFTGFANIFIDVGFGSALIQKKDITQQDLSTVFWFNVISGSLLTILFILAAPFISAFYNIDALRSLTILLSFNFFISSLGNVQRVLLAKKLDFKLPFKIRIISQLISDMVGIILALNGYGVWSIALKVILQGTLTTSVYWITSNWRPSLVFSKESVKKLMSFSLNLLGNDSLNYWVRNIDNLLIGKFLGNFSLGLYSKAYGILTLPIRNISSVISRVLFPSLSYIQDDINKVRSVYLKVVSSIAFFTFPMMIGLFIIADKFVLYIFGEQWVGMIPVFKIFCILSLPQSFGNVISNLYMSQGATGLMFKVGTFLRIFLISAIVLGLQWGIEGIALSYTCASFISNFINHYFAGKLVNLKYTEILNQLKPVFLCSVSMAIIVAITGILLEDKFSDGFLLLFQIIIGIISYLLIVHIYNLKTYKFLVNILREELLNKKLVKNFK